MVTQDRVFKTLRHMSAEDRLRAFVGLLRRLKRIGWEHHRGGLSWADAIRQVPCPGASVRRRAVPVRDFRLNGERAR